MCIEEKATRFSDSPREGYLAGYCPYTKPMSLQLDSRLVRVRRWNEKLAWLYAVAEHDIPADHYSWQLVDQDDGSCRILINTNDPT